MRKNYGELKQASKTRRRKLAEDVPDTRASERFKTPAYQAGRMILAQADIHRIRWIDLVDYLLQHVMDGSIRLTDPVPIELDQRLNESHLDVAEYLVDKFNIKEGVNANE